MNSQVMGDGLKFFGAELHFIKNHDVVRRSCSALDGTVCLEEEIDWRGVSTSFHSQGLQRLVQGQNTNQRHRACDS